MKFLRMLGIGGVQRRVGPGEHLRPQGFGVVVGEDEAHARRQSPKLFGILARAGDDHVPAAAQQCLKGHLPGALGPAVHRPGVEQYLVVDEPAPEPHGEGCALQPEGFRHIDPVPRLKPLVVPEPEVLYPQQLPADGVDAVDEAPHISRQDLQRPTPLPEYIALRSQVCREKQPYLTARLLTGAADKAQVPPQSLYGAADGLRVTFRRQINDGAVLIEKHGTPSPWYK